MPGRHDFVVVGGGLAGLTVTLALATRGQRVVLLDDWRPGAATRASAGMLAPGLGFAASVAAIGKQARDCYPALVASLREVTGIHVPLNRRGVIELAPGADGVERMHALAPHGAERLSAADLARLEPMLRGHRGGLLHPLDGAVDTVRLMEALDAAVAASPAVTRMAAAVHRLRLSSTGAVLDTGAGSLSGGCVVLAGGAWAGTLAGLPAPVLVRPVRGELMLLATAGPGHVVYEGGGYLVPRDGAVLVGATSDEGGFATHATMAGGAALGAIAARLCPALAGAPVTDHWAGLRPVSPDGLPILGVDPGHPVLAYAAGYSRNGILFAPWAAEHLADELMGEPCPALDPFRITRFSGH